jgi:hypothetical protein
MVASRITLIVCAGAAPFRVALCLTHARHCVAQLRLIPLEPKELAFVGRGDQPCVDWSPTPGVPAVEPHPRGGIGCHCLTDLGTHAASRWPTTISA